jgi:glucose-6-phosphate 1-epimerase
MANAQFSPITLTHPQGASLVYCPYGAHATSWRTAQGREWLYLSPLADFTPGQSIRGGVPIIFPQFSGFGTGLRHGFARILPWQPMPSSGTAEGCSQSHLRLQSDPYTLSLWPHKFCLDLKFTLQANSLSIELSVTNTDTTPWAFAAALHSYFAVQLLTDVSVTGLQGTAYWDNNGSNFATDRHIMGTNELKFDDAIDRVFFNAHRPVTLINGLDRLQIESQGFADLVIWNPGPKGALSLQDLPDQDYQQMLCIEAAQVDTLITLAPGQTWQGQQRLTSF